MSVSRNLRQFNLYQDYVDSLSRQNYSNYKVFYVDDASNDTTVELMENYILVEHPEMKEKISIIANK